MKTRTTALIALLTAFTATAAHADHRGDLGYRSPDASNYRTSAPSYFNPGVRVAVPFTSPDYPYAFAPRRDGAPGFWQDVTVKVWVPANWTIGRNRWGHATRVFEPAHFAFTTNRVWVGAGGENYCADSSRDGFRRY